MKFSGFNAAGIAGLFMLTSLSVPAGADTVIVYDASNSMWGQIEGEAKVTIARRVLSDLVRDWDASEPLGLVAYGHRREGDCSDIETVVAPGPIDRDLLLARIEGISPTGKTPLTAAVRHAAEELRYRDAPANVILISDGLETCDADPCAAASELNETGINFTAHVIGFDVGDADQAQLACIAENTGGRFFAARDAAGLQAALFEATEIATEAVPEAEVTISAPDTAVAGSNVEVQWEGENIHPRDLVTIVPADAASDARGDYKRVGDRASATLLAPGEAGLYQARYVSSATGRSVAQTSVELTAPETEVSAPESAVAGGSITVTWTRVIHPRDYVTIVEAGALPDLYNDYKRVGNGREARLQVPAEPGEYEVRYVLNEGDRPLATAQLAVTAPETGITAPESAMAGSSITVTWTRVIHPRDYVTIVEAGAPPNVYNDYKRVGNGREARLQVPAEPGEYEVRYVLNEGDRPLASAPLTVTAPETGITAPESAMAGSSITVTWTRVIHPRDYVTIVEAGAPPDASNDYKRVGGGREARLQVPAEPGEYEVRYVLNEGDRPLASAPLTVTAPETGITAPESAMAGSSITVAWTRVVHPRDYVTIVEAGAPPDASNDYKRVGNGREARLQVPAEPGEYEVRYVLNEGDRPLATAPLTVTAAQVSLTAPETAAADSRFEVNWDQSVHPRDKITVVPADAPASEDGDYKRVGNGTFYTLKAPETPGDYQVRYLLNASGQAIARAAIRVE